MFSDDVVLTCPCFGVCEIDVERIKEEWHEGAYIQCHEEFDSGRKEYRLVEFLKDAHQSNPGNRLIRNVIISSEDAVKIIKDLHLVGIRSQLFKNRADYVTVTCTN